MNEVRNKKIKKILHRSIVFVLILILIIPTPFGEKAEAVVYPTVELPGTLLATTLTIAQSTGSQASKEYFLDNIGWSVAKLVLKGLTRSVVNWINSGFQGNPAFVTDPKAFFADIVDQEIGRFIEGTELNALCSPFRLKIKMALVLNRGRYQNKAACRLTNVIENYDNFINGIERQLGAAGGWQGWWAVSTRDNAYSQYMNAEAELAVRINNKVLIERDLLNWGNGFLSFRDCSLSIGGDGGREAAQSNSEGTAITSDCPIVNPGTFIENHLAETAGSGIRQLELADEINEIVGALMYQFTTQALSSSGLYGLSRSSGSNQSYLSKLRNEERTDYGQMRSVTVTEINKNIEIENSYIEAKSVSLRAVNRAQSLADQIITCYNAKLSPSSPVVLTEVERQAAGIEIATASTTIKNVIEPLRARVRQNTSSAEDNISQLTALKEAMNSAASVTNFNDLVNEYVKLRPKLHREEDVPSVIPTEENDAIAAQLPLEELQVKYNACLLFPVRTTTP